MFSGELAADYAPELKLVGIAAAAPATNLVDLFKAQKGSIAGNSLTAMALLSWSKTYKLPLDSVLESGVDASFEKVAGSCIQSISQMLKLLQLAKPLKKSFLKADPTTLPAWRDLMEKNSPGKTPPGVPVYLAQGTGDVTVDPNITVRFAKQLCASGSPVVMKLMKGVRTASPPRKAPTPRQPGCQTASRTARRQATASGAERSVRRIEARVSRCCPRSYA